MRATRTTIAPLAALLAGATLATPATALAADAPTQPARTHSTYTLPRNFVPPDVRDYTEGRGTFNAPEVTVIRVPQPVAHGGMDWGDAAIGAGGATGLLAISLAGVALRRRHEPRTQSAIG